MEIFKSTKPVFYANKSENRTGVTYINGKLLRTSAIGEPVTIMDYKLGKVQIFWNDFKEFGNVSTAKVEFMSATELMEKIKAGQCKILTEFFDPKCIEVEFSDGTKKFLNILVTMTAETRMFFFNY